MSQKKYFIAIDFFFKQCDIKIGNLSHFYGQQNKYQKNVISNFYFLKVEGHCEAMLDVTKNIFINF